MTAWLPTPETLVLANVAPCVCADCCSPATTWEINDEATGPLAGVDERRSAAATPVVGSRPTLPVANSLSFVVGFSLYLRAVPLRSQVRWMCASPGGTITVWSTSSPASSLSCSRCRCSACSSSAFLMRDYRVGVAPGRAGLLPSFILGLTFAAGWTPCVGPQLTAILSVASLHEFAGLPAMLLYCTGLGLPFVVAAAFAGHFSR